MCLTSVHSNHQGPGHNIASAFAGYNRVRHILSDGFLVRQIGFLLGACFPARPQHPELTAELLRLPCFQPNFNPSAIMDKKLLHSYELGGKTRANAKSPFLCTAVDTVLKDILT
ncbi:hypothetical protein BT69DRAFT_1284916 [Atractiella rhizophila]|nr:hypothetical protein BT69DRAFT_1284916 [Atractiella rhizophila]